MSCVLKLEDHPDTQRIRQRQQIDRIARFLSMHPGRIPGTLRWLYLESLPQGPPALKTEQLYK